MIKKLAGAAALLLCAAPASAGIVFGAASYNASLTLAGNGSSITTAIAYANGSYYTGQGSHLASPIAQYSATGALIAGPLAPTPGVDFRALSATSAGALYAKGYASNVMYRQEGALDNFVGAVTLAGNIADQAQVVVSADGSTFYGNNNGILHVWNSAGALLRTVQLASGTSSTAIAIYGDYAINQSGGVLRAFDVFTGALVDQATLVGPRSSYADIGFSQGYGNGYFFVGGADHMSAVGYAIGNAPVAGVPEPATWAMMMLGFGAMGAALRRRQAAPRVRYA